MRERKRRFTDFLLGHVAYQKNYKFSKNIEKTPYRRIAKKWYNFAPGAANHTFFTHPAYAYKFLYTYERRAFLNRQTNTITDRLGNRLAKYIYR